MNQEKMRIDRVLAATIHERSALDTTREVYKFFSSCLKQRNHPRFTQIEQELVALDNLVFYLLNYQAVKGGFFRLETEDMTITLSVSYEIAVREENLDVPSLATLGILRAESPVTLVIGRNPDVPIDESILAIVEEINQRKALTVRIETTAGSKPIQKYLQQYPVRLLNVIVSGLQLSPRLVEEKAEELVESTDLWKAEEALVAHTIVAKNLRIIIGKVESDREIEVDKIRFHFERAEISEYSLGVFLIPPFTERENWKQDRKGYRDFIVGDISQEQLDKAVHLLLS